MHIYLCAIKVMYEILPSILTSDYLKLESNIDELTKSGLKELHLDVMDGSFVPNITFGHKLINDIHKRFNDLKLDVHLMINNPFSHIDQFIQAGASSIIFQIETISLKQLVLASEILKKNNVKLGIAVGYKTDIKKIYKYLSKVNIDYVLLMSVQEGAGGQEFDNRVFKKIEELKRYIEKNKKNSSNSVSLEIDGGINESNFKNVIDSGVTRLVVGNSIFKNENIAENFKKFL